MVSYPSINLVDMITDEVALEGLDGITVEALWMRLAHRFHKPLPLPKALTVQIWSICVQIKEFMFYELQVPRETLVIFDRYEFVDPDLGTILEPDNVPTDIYPHSPVQDFANGIKGSCSTYNTRKNITESVRIHSLESVVRRYGQKLVIVASQYTRERALMGNEVCPMLDLNVTQYCFLERVGRSRYHGEVTQGKLSLNALKEDPKSLFYHRKFLLRHKLITKQIYHQKSGGHSCNGSLLHLPRFFVERKPKVIFLAEQVIEILKAKPNYVAEYDEIRRKLRIENSIKKLFKTSFFQKVVRTDLRVPYRTLYPNADPSEWQLKNNASKEKRIKVVQLLVPHIDIAEVWNKDEIQEDDDPQELNIKNHKYGVPYMKQANLLIEANKSDGICQGSLAKEMGLTKLQSRTVLRNLVKTKIVATYMNDVGRQRLTKYVSKRFENNSTMSKQFKKEMHKIKEFKKLITTETDNSDKNKIKVEENNDNNIVIDQPEDTKNSPATDVETQNNMEINEKPTVIATLNKKELTNLFYVVNRILYKYRLTKCVTKYKHSFSKISSGLTDKKELKENQKNENKSDSIIHGTPNNDDTSSLHYKNIKTKLTPSKLLNTRKKPVSQIFGFMEEVKNNEKKKVSNITYRLLRRANMIIESVKEHQVIDDMTKLMKMINEEEDKEGYDVKIDKKSLLRLLQKLAKDNLVKNIKLTLSGNGREKSLTFICDPNIDISHAVIQSAVEQAKLKFCLIGSSRNKFPVKKSMDAFASNNDGIGTTNKSEMKVVPQPVSKAKAAKRYGYSPKFLRMQALHIFLHYLVYDHPGEQSLSKKEQIEALRANGFGITNELAQEFNAMYTLDVSWKMFVPPLPNYNGWPKGWTLMCDILLRIPLSIFLKIHYVPYVVEDLNNYLNHPIRKYYLVRDLPVDLRNSLLSGRKYIFNIHETVTRLCYLGLVQFGPQRLKEKDQVFIYVNRQTELLDTTSSAPSYHIIEDKSYPVMKYKFDQIQVVEKYWYDMWNTCINTLLGDRLVVQGKDILLEELGKKADMIRAVTARTIEEAIKLDVGFVPGDRKGAAGLDSACFAHLKRNWSWGLCSSGQSKYRRKNNLVQERDTYLSKIKAKPLKFTEFSGLKKVSGPPSVNATELRKKVYEHLSKTTEKANQKNYEELTSQRSTKQKSFVRRVLPRKSNTRKRTKYDEIDYRALQRMHKLRVDWEPHEDKILLVCKVAMMYLCPNPRKQIVNFTTIRDILRAYSYTSYNKTSRACQRRLLYMLRQQQTVNSVTLGVEEINQNFFISKRFGGIADKLKVECKNSHEYEKRMEEVFKTLVGYVARKFYDISEIGPKQPLPVPMTAQEFNVFYKTIHPAKPFSNRGFIKDIRSVNDIHFATINSVIHSSMCCGKDRRSWAYQLFKVYQQYPEILLRNSMAKIRADQMVTIKKPQMCAIKKYGNYMPMSSSQYQLSTYYIYKFQTKWPYDLFKETYDVLTKLVTWYNRDKKENNPADQFDGIEVLPVTGGMVTAIHDYLIQGQIDFDIEIPEQIIMLDPRLKEKDETYFRIAQRYQDVLASLDHLKLSKDPFQDSIIPKIRAPTNVAKDGAESDDNYNANNINTNQSNIDFLSPNKIGDAGDKNNSDDAKEFLDHDIINLDSEEENCITMDEEINVIKLEDGTKIVLNENDARGSEPDSKMEGMGLEEQITSTVLSGLENNNRNNDNSSRNLELNADTNEEISAAIPARKRPREINEKKCDEPKEKRTKSCNEFSSASSEKETSEPPKNENSSISQELTKENEIDDNSPGASTNDDVKMNENEQAEKINTNEAEIGTTLESKKETPMAFTRVSDILRNVSSRQDYSSPYCKNDETTDIQKRYTRIALLRMREELNELTLADSHHAHEYFVVNMFKIYYSLQTSDSQLSSDTQILQDSSKPFALFPAKTDAAHELLRGINKFALFPKDIIPYSDFKKTLPKNTSLDLNSMDAVYKFVRDKKEIGATIQDLLDKFENKLGKSMYEIVTLLTANHLLLRSGVTSVRYIHHRHSNPWSIHSYKIHRLEKESLIPVPRGTMYVVDSETQSAEDVDMNVAEVSNEETSLVQEKEPAKATPEQMDVSNNQSELQEVKNENENMDKDQSSNSSEERDLHTRRRMQRKRTRLLPQKDISRAAKQLDLTTAEEVRVVIKPWIRIDGLLNRRVLDRMLGAILTYCLTHPGITLAKVQNRFIAVLQPFHVRELVEMLIKLKCLERRLLKKPRVTLFSKPSDVRPSTADHDFALEDDIILEPAVGATLKFALFLSTKMYNADFIA